MRDEDIHESPDGAATASMRLMTPPPLVRAANNETRPKVSSVTLAEGHATLITGGPASGKTRLALATTLGLLQRGAGVCFLTSDAPADVMDNPEHVVGGNLHPFLDAKKLLVLSYHQAFRSKLMTLGDARAPADELVRELKAKSIRFLVADTIEPIVSAATEADVGRFVGPFVTALGRAQITGLCTAFDGGADRLRVSLAALCAEFTMVHHLGPWHAYGPATLHCPRSDTPCRSPQRASCSN